MLAENPRASRQIFLDGHNCKEVCIELLSLKPTTGNESSVQIPVTKSPEKITKITRKIHDNVLMQ